MSLLLEFVNMTNMPVWAIADLYRKYEIINSDYGRRTGKEIFFISKRSHCLFAFDDIDEAKKQRKHEEETIYIASVSRDESKESIEKRLSGAAKAKGFTRWRAYYNWKKEYDQMILLPHEFGQKLSHVIIEMQHDYRGFLNDCMRGTLNIYKLNALISRLSHIKISDNKLIPSADPWKPKTTHNATYNCLEDYIDYNDILLPILTGQGDKFNRLKRCDYCESYFFAKSLKAIFCSDKCRKDYHREKTLSKEIRSEE